MSTKYPQGVITATPPFQSTTAQSFSGVWTLEQLGKNYFYYQQPVAKSLRFRSSATAYLNRTPSTGGNRTTWTWSAWVKRGTLGAQGCLFQAGVNGTTDTGIYFRTDNAIDFYTRASSTIQGYITTVPVYRDPSSWYHLVCVYDSTNATASNRMLLYINGVQQNVTINNTLAQNTPSEVNNSVSHYIGALSSITGVFDGYLAEVNFIDGQALDPSYFGQLSTITGVWAPKKYVGSYGGNGFYLPFTDATSTTTIGYDYSGNGNNWTTNNISLTSGVTYDSMWDSPTSYDNGGNGVGNYAVLNPLDSGSSGVLVETDGNLSASQSTGLSTYRCGTSTIIPTSSKYYAEFVIGSIGSGSVVGAGVIEKQHSRDNYAGGSSGGVGYLNDGRVYLNTALAATYSTFTTNDVISVAVDYDTGKVWFAVNNTWQNSGNPATGANAVATLTPANLMAICGTTARGSGASGATGFYANFGQRPFSYTPPTGFKALNTQNLPAVSIANGANHMAATLYTGNGGTQSIVNAYNSVSFKPDLVWCKSRSGAGNHSETDSVRGVNKQLFTNLTDAEGSQTDQITAFNSGGFSLGANTAGTGSVNVNGVTYVAWQWKAGGTAVTNTAGSITSSVSANPTAGFSVVTYTGNGTNPGATIGHGLGIAPSMIITKARNTAGTWWPTYHSALPISNTLYLNDTVASTTYVNRFSAVSSSTFTTGTNGSELNTNAVTYVAYCFAAIPGYSAFGSYTGNGSTDGPFVYCGFRPRWILVKRSDASGNWFIRDISRDPYNASIASIYPNLSDAEYSPASAYDILSNGFKVRTSASGNNGSGEVYVWAAFAENPFKYSLAR